MTQNENFFMDALVLLGIGLYCLLASIFGPDFSKIHFQLPFLHIPFFIGEQLLFILMILLMIKWEQAKHFERWHWAWIIYFSWILAETLAGYMQWGPLAFRNAALFYYVAFFLIGYTFYNRNLLLQPLVYRILLAALLFCILTSFIDSYYFFTFFILVVILMHCSKNKIVPAVVAMALFIFYIPHFFVGSRSHLVGILGAAIFLYIVFSSWSKQAQKYYLLGGILVAGVILFGLKHFADPNGVKSLVHPSVVMKLYKEDKSYVDKVKKYYVPAPLTVDLFRETEDKDFYSVKMFQNFSWMFKAKAPVTSGSAIVQPCKKPDASSTAVKIPCNTPAQVPVQMKTGQPRPLDNAYNNILFRWFIWEDMIDEVFKSKGNILFGVGFGKPQRSKTIEILGWAEGEWSRDGWIAPHNSYLHLFYRAGIFGLLIIFMIVHLFISILKDFIRYRSVKGILLLSVLLYWLIMANFLLILEFPYYAILFWSIFGMTFAYAQDLRNKTEFTE